MPNPGSFTLGPFLGLATSVDPTSVAEGYSPDMLNVRLDGNATGDALAIKPRYGWRNIYAAQAGASSMWGFGYLRGYDSSKALVERFASCETVSGTVNLYEHTAAGTRTQITPSSGSLGLSGSAFQFAAMDGYGYAVPNKSNPVRWTLGTPTGTALVLAPPSAPTSRLTYTLTDSVSTLSWSGTSALTGAGEVGLNPSSTVIGCQSASSLETGATQTGVTTIEWDFGSLGMQNWQNNDIFCFQVSTVAQLTGASGSIPGNFRGTYDNATTYKPGDLVHYDLGGVNRVAICIKTSTGNDPTGMPHPGGSTAYWLDLKPYDAGTHDDGFAPQYKPKWTMDPPVFQLDPSSVTLTITDNSSNVYTPKNVRMVNVSANTWAIWCEFDKTTGRSNWATIRKVKFTYSISKADPNPLYNQVLFSAFTVGNINYTGNGIFDTVPYNMSLSYTYANSASGQESAMPACSADTSQPGLIISPISKGKPAVTGLPPMGTKLVATGTASGDSNVDTNNFYADVLPVVPNGSSDPGFRLAATSTNTAHSATIAQSYYSLITQTLQVNSADFSGAIAAVPFKGWFVWLMKGGKQNVRHSKVGNPTSLANPLIDRTDDASRGADFTLSDNFGDEPFMGHQADDSLIILGNKGVYAQVSGLVVVQDQSGFAMTGFVPSTFSPPKRLAKAQPCAGRFASDRWSVENQAGVAYLDTEGNVWWVEVTANFDGENGYSMIELSKDIRGAIDAARSAQSLNDFSTARVLADIKKDSLWVILGKYAFVLRRPNLLSGVRLWEKYQYTNMTPTFAYGAFTSNYGYRFLMSDGSVSEVEWNSSTPAWITGSNRENGAALAQANCYWASRNYMGPNTRIMHVRADKVSPGDSVDVKIISDRETTTKTIAANTQYAKFGMLQQGWKHQIYVYLPETCAGIRKVVCQTFEIGKRLLS